MKARINGEKIFKTCARKVIKDNQEVFDELANY